MLIFISAFIGFVFIHNVSGFGICPKDFLEGAGSINCYKYFPDVKNWYQANANCEAIGAELVTITNEIDNSFVASISKANIWIGLNRINGDWGWTSSPSEPVTYFNWQSVGESEQDPDGKDPNSASARDIFCASFITSSEAWGDRACSSNACYHYICQVPVPPTGIPTSAPSVVPSFIPTALPSIAPSSSVPSSLPTGEPTSGPISSVPTVIPTALPTSKPTPAPTKVPSVVPTEAPTHNPTPEPTHNPTPEPTHNPTPEPTHNPTALPTVSSTTLSSTIAPIVSRAPSIVPTVFPTTQTASPSVAPSAEATEIKNIDTQTLSTSASSDKSMDIVVVVGSAVGVIVSIGMVIYFLCYHFTKHYRRKMKEAEQDTTVIELDVEEGLTEFRMSQEIKNDYAIYRSRNYQNMGDDISTASTESSVIVMLEENPKNGLNLSITRGEDIDISNFYECPDVLTDEHNAM